jgi:uncharacterized protein (DUF111 family)
MRILYLDCFSGISGDMTVGALTDLGITPSTFEWELSKLDLGDCHLHFERQARGGISGVKFDVHSGATHDASQDDGHHPHETARPRITAKPVTNMIIGINLTTMSMSIITTNMKALIIMATRLIRPGVFPRFAT